MVTSLCVLYVGACASRGCVSVICDACLGSIYEVQVVFNTALCCYNVKKCDVLRSVDVFKSIQLLLFSLKTKERGPPPPSCLLLRVPDSRLSTTDGPNRRRAAE